MGASLKLKTKSNASARNGPIVLRRSSPVARQPTATSTG